MTCAASPARRWREIGVVFQSRALDADLTVAQNLAYHAALHGMPPRAARARAAEVVAQVGLSDQLRSPRREALGRPAAPGRDRPRAAAPPAAAAARRGRRSGSTCKRAARWCASCAALAAEAGVGVLWATHLFDEIEPGRQVVVLHHGRVLATDTAAAARRRRAASPRPSSRMTGLEPRGAGMSLSDLRLARARSGRFGGIVWREGLRFVRQRERFLSALVRPLVWLFIFAAGFRAVLGLSITPPYQTYVLYEVYVTPGLLRDDPALQRHAVLALDGLRPRDRGDAHAAGQPVPALVPADREADRRRRGLDPAGLCLPRHRLVLGHPAAGPRLSDRAAGAGPRRHDARLDRAVPLLGDPPAREFRRGDELRDLPDVLRLLGALSALAPARSRACSCSRHRRSSTPSPTRSS